MLLPSAAAVPDATTTPPSLKAVLWDMDGTLVDTEPYWIAAEIGLVSEHGGHWDVEKAMGLVGNALESSAAVLQDAGVQLSVREIVDHLSHSVIASVRKELPWRPGARELLAELHGRGVRCALVTMSERNLAAVERLRETDPELTGGHCVAIEDSVPGVASAVASGVATIAVPNAVPLPEDPSRTLWTTLAGRTYDDVATVLAAHAASAGAAS